jgi:hypothetical protein
MLFVKTATKIKENIANSENVPLHSCAAQSSPPENQWLSEVCCQRVLTLLFKLGQAMPHAETMTEVFSTST